MWTHAATAAMDFVQQLVLPDPQPPPGPAEDQIERIVGIINWFALISLGVAFLGGLILFTAGRVVDHHRLGRTGTIFMLSSVAGAILYVSVPPVLSDFVTGG